MLNFFKRKKKIESPELKLKVTEDNVTVSLDAQDVQELKEVLLSEVDTDAQLEKQLNEDEKQPLIDTAAMTHIGTRKYQQDAFFVSAPAFEKPAVLAVLCDGMGGMDSGELASGEVVLHYAKLLQDFDEQDDIPKLLLKVTYSANDVMHEKFLSKGKEAGTTLVCACIKQDKLYWVSVGDSRIYLVRNGEIARLTKDHNYALQLQKKVESGEITQQAADTNPQKEALVSYLGAPSLELIDLSSSPFTLMPNDVIMLCSDGVTKSLDDEEILNILSEKLTLKESVHRLVISAVDAGFNAQDNTTSVLLRYTGN